MSHRLSQNARHTQELLQELERDKELDVLRVYLTKYNLFPRKRDPKTAPIRAEELRDLVKHWKLHRQRNFWKNHATKEELVRTLYKYINTKVLPSERIGDKSAGMASAAGLASPTSSSGPPTPIVPERPKTPVPESPAKKPLFDRRLSNRSLLLAAAMSSTAKSPSRRGEFVLESYLGDLFGQRGDYEDGMIYLSRLGNVDVSTSTDNHITGNQVITHERDVGSRSDVADDIGDEKSTPKSRQAILAAPTSPTATAANNASSDASSIVELMDDDSTTRETRMKQECASSLYQLTLHVGHEVGIVQEGCVPALVRLSMFDDYDVKKYAAAATVNLTCDSSLCSRMLDDGLLVGLMEFSKVQQEDIRRNAAIGMCRISYERLGQQRLLQEGSVPAMISMLNSTDNDTKEACIKAIVNIASFSGTSVVYTMVKMSGLRKQDLSCLRFMGETICNLSLLSGPRVKAVEDGVLEPIAVIGHHATDVDVLRLAATALCNFSTVEANHALLSQLRVLKCIEVLLEVPDESIRELGAVTVANLTCSPDSVKSIIQSNIAIKLIQIGYTTNDVIQENVSLALSNLAISEEDKELFLTRSGVVLMLLQFLKAGSAVTQENAVCTLCSLMAHESSRSELMQCDMIGVLLQLASAPLPQTRELAAMSMLNFSAHADLSPYLLAPDTLKSLISLFVGDDVADQHPKDSTVTLSRIQDYCLSCLYNLSFYTGSRAQLVSEGCVGALALVFRKPSRVADQNKRVVATVCNFTFCVEGQARLLADDGLRLMKRLTVHCTIKEVLLCASTALCNIATVAIDQPNSPVLSMLIVLSHTAHSDISLNCAIAFNKLAGNSGYAEALSRCAELAPSLTMMMRSGVEDVQIHCAAALCGLASDRTSKLHRTMWKDNAIGDFIVNSLLRINSDSTKEICARVLFNVLTHDDGRVGFIKDGVLYALVKLARLDSVEIRTLCVTALYNLSCDESMVPVLMDINVAQVISKMCESEANSEANRQRLAACLTNIALCPGNEAKLVEGGVLGAIMLLCDHGDLQCLRYSASALCSISNVPDCCVAMASLLIVELLLKMINSKDGTQCIFALNALCNISCIATNHDKIEEGDAICSVLRVLDESEEEAIVLTCTKIVCNLSYDIKHHGHILKYRFVRTMVKVFSQEVVYPSVADVVARILATLSENANEITALVNDGAVHVLRVAARYGSPSAVSNCVISLCRLSRGGHSGMRILEDGLFDIIATAIPLEYPPQVGPRVSAATSERCSMILRTLSTYLMCISSMVADRRIVPIVAALAFHGDKDTCTNCVMLLHNITAARNRLFQKEARLSGVIPLLIKLSKVGPADVRLVCSVSLAHLNSDLTEAERDAQDEFEKGLVATLISMLDMDASMMQKVEKVASALPPPLVLAAKAAADWDFLHGVQSTRILQQIPITWTTQSAAIDQGRFHPIDPSEFLSMLPSFNANRTPTVKDTLFGQFRVLKVSPDKCFLKPAPRNSAMSPTTVLRHLGSSSANVPTAASVVSPTASGNGTPKAPHPSSTTVSILKKDDAVRQGSATAVRATKPATPKKSKPSIHRMGSQMSSTKQPTAAAVATHPEPPLSAHLLPKIV
ncbi:hypothetical protein DYB36_001324 [Aphanomyces astaci]|uniref:Vacuolar protein 8 n=1 Tax=Aphanomyces astaci TaxID=112090 RepID=A0A397AR36_APHAT|nr:hypothetical protein DYB36_001324 [Aphanomyces astaci]